MRVRYKTLGITAITLIITISLVYVAAQSILLQSYMNLEAQSARDDVGSALRVIDYDQSVLASIAMDYANWDDTANFLIDHNADYIDTNFVDATLLNLRLNAVILADIDDNIVYGKSVNFSTQQESPLPAGLIESLTAGSPLFRSSEDEPLTGILALPDGLMMIGAYPVKDSTATGPSRGTIMMGRFLDDEEMDKLRNITGIAMSLVPPGSAGTPDLPAIMQEPGGDGILVVPADRDTVSSYTVIRDLYGSPAMVLRVDQPRTIYAQWQTSMLYIVAILFVLSTPAALFGALLADRFVISRIVRLSARISQIGANNEFSGRLEDRGNDELSAFAGKINEALDALDRSRQQLQDNEERLRSMVENINEVIWETDAAMLLTYISPKARNIFGYQPENLKGRSPFDLIKPEERDHIRSIIHEMNVRNGSFAGVEFWIARPDGTLACIEVGGNVIRDGSGEITGYRGIARDITERRQAEETLRVSEERLRLCAATARFGTFDWDPVTDQHFWSPETYEIYGFPPDTPLTFERLTGSIYPGDRQDAVIAAALDPAGPGGYSMEYRIIRASDSAIRWVYVRARVFFQGEGDRRRAVRVLGAIQDITDRKQSEEAMAASLGEKDVLLKEIHHRVKNNLQIISSLLSLQSGSVKTENPAIMFRESQDRIRSMALIHEKLYQSRDISRIDFAGYVRSLTSYLMHSYATGQRVNVVVDIENVLLGIDTAIPCGLIINELVSNSFKYAFQDGRPGELRIGLAREGDLYVLTVGDNGVGLPPGLDYLNTRSLGLQLVNTLVSQLEGTIELDGSQGTRFRIVFKEIRSDFTKKAPPG
ncbi:MAG: putative diguanylate cyclase [Methanocella sp. PtaU1.Bin125]|nr:MAG: putative diguanylate cyclase [Methanocella sp. PtaU1.Bin125]